MLNKLSANRCEIRPIESRKDNDGEISCRDRVRTGGSGRRPSGVRWSVLPGSTREFAVDPGMVARSYAVEPYAADTPGRGRSRSPGRAAMFDTVFSLM